jgi:uncharacterized protein YecE (DUF72 family)
MAKIFIGTSGYIYSHWEDGVFYPTGLPKSKNWNITQNTLIQWN